MKKYINPDIIFEAVKVSDIITASPFSTTDENLGDIQSFGDLVHRVQ